MKTSLPNDLLKSLSGVAGFNEASFIQAHEEVNPITSIRINPSKKISSQKLNLPILEMVPWCENGYYLSHRPSFTTDPLFHAGAYYVQEASSMFLSEVIKQSCELDTPLKVLDLCAAPGGKSTLIASLINQDSLLISNEVIKNRVHILTENIIKWGASNIVITHNDPKDFEKLPNYFDLILVDAPCSGSGLFRKDKKAIEEWSAENVKLCYERQQRILSNVLPSLKPNGILIYSTCSYSFMENEGIVNWAITNKNMDSFRIQLKDDWNIVETQENHAFGYRFYPDRVKGEGFFISVLKKKGQPEDSYHSKQKAATTLHSKTTIRQLEQFIENTNNMAFFDWKEEITAISTTALNELGILQSALYIKKAGINIGKWIKGNLVPSHELIMHSTLKLKLPKKEIDKNQALDYLRLHPIEIPVEELGWIILTYESVPIGLIKAMPNRINNYYPKEWRIVHK